VHNYAIVDWLRNKALQSASASFADKSGKMEQCFSRKDSFFSRKHQIVTPAINYQLRSDQRASLLVNWCHYQFPAHFTN
jgi:hypothetical protein